MAKKTNFSQKLHFLCNQLDTVFSFFFTYTNQNQSRTTERPAVEQKQDQQEVRHVNLMGINIFITINTDMNTGD